MPINSLADIIASLGDLRILVVGDIMLDRFVYGDVTRISPEAPAVIIHAETPKDALGGAANVAANVSGMTARCYLAGIVGRDETGRRVRELLNATLIVPELIEISERPTTIKMRFVAHLHNTHLLRADWEEIGALDPANENALIARINRLIPQVDAVILSDYNKGVLTDRVVRDTIATARAHAIPVVVDPKASRYDRYRGATTLTPNVLELGQALRRPVIDEPRVLAAAALELMDVVACDYVLVTRGEHGILFVDRDGSTDRVPATAHTLVDVSGAGDTLVSCFTLGIAARAEPRIAARFANAGAGVGVSRAGTSVVTREDLISQIIPRPMYELDGKIAPDRASLLRTVEAWKSVGLTVGFTNGCFDLLHPGHIRLLQRARSNCERLVIGLNSDASVQRLKGNGRPIQNQAARAMVLAALAFVDAVTLFDEDTPLDLIAAVRPHVLIKGADYSLDQVVGREIVESAGGRVLLVDLVPHSSTSRIADTIVANTQHDLTDARGQPASRTLCSVTVRLGGRSPLWLCAAKKPALFLDRDGIIIRDSGFVHDPRDVILYSGVALAIAAANARDIPVVVVSNQSGVGRKLFTWGAVTAVDDAIQRALAAEGASVDLVIYAGAGPEVGDDPLDCRKPAPGMFVLAQRILGLDLARSVMVGDQRRDLEAAARAGVDQNIFVDHLAYTMLDVGFEGIQITKVMTDPGDAIRHGLDLIAPE